MGLFCDHDWFYGEYSDYSIFTGKEIMVYYKECTKCGKRVVISKG